MVATQQPVFEHLLTKPRAADSRSAADADGGTPCGAPPSMWSVSPAYLSFDVGSFGVPRESRSPAVLSFFWAGAMAFGWVIGAVVAAPDVDGGASFTRVSAEPGGFLLPSMSPPRWSWSGEPSPGGPPGGLGVGDA